MQILPMEEKTYCKIKKPRGKPRGFNCKILTLLFNTAHGDTGNYKA
jgi:hypothetical protein